MAHPPNVGMPMERTVYQSLAGEPYADRILYGILPRSCIWNRRLMALFPSADLTESPGVAGYPHMTSAECAESSSGRLGSSPPIPNRV
jgi:hypothetical protein